MYCKNCGEAMNENQDICIKCGIKKGKGDGFCEHCGNAVPKEAEICMSCGCKVKKAKKSNSNDFEAEALITFLPILCALGSAFVSFFINNIIGLGIAFVGIIIAIYLLAKKKGSKSANIFGLIFSIGALLIAALGLILSIVAAIVSIGLSILSIVAPAIFTAIAGAFFENLPSYIEMLLGM